jgi:hypothetical protein
MSMPRAVDNTDWLKTAAAIAAALGHFGHFFMEDDRWWAVFGRVAAPTFFFLLGYARTRAVPLRWIWIGVALTLLNSWNAGWTWVAPNILLSLALIRVARPHVQVLVRHHGWIAFGLLVVGLIAVVPIADKIIDYGAEGWLWALFGLCQRTYVDGMSARGVNGAAQNSTSPADPITYDPAMMRLLACAIAAIIYVWQEQREFDFTLFQLAVVIAGVGALSACLCRFRRGPSRIQPPEPSAGALRFIGRHTLEIYAIQLAGSELIVKLVPGLAP